MDGAGELRLNGVPSQVPRWERGRPRHAHPRDVTPTKRKPSEPGSPPGPATVCGEGSDRTGQGKGAGGAIALLTPPFCAVLGSLLPCLGWWQLTWELQVQRCPEAGLRPLPSQALLPFPSQSSSCSSEGQSLSVTRGGGCKHRSFVPTGSQVGQQAPEVNRGAHKAHRPEPEPQPVSPGLAQPGTHPPALLKVCGLSPKLS